MDVPFVEEKNKMNLTEVETKLWSYMEKLYHFGDWEKNGHISGVKYEANWMKRIVISMLKSQMPGLLLALKHIHNINPIEFKCGNFECDNNKNPMIIGSIFPSTGEMTSTIPTFSVLSCSKCGTILPGNYARQFIDCQHIWRLHEDDRNYNICMECGLIHYPNDIYHCSLCEQYVEECNCNIAGQKPTGRMQALEILLSIMTITELQHVGIMVAARTMSHPLIKETLDKVSETGRTKKKKKKRSQRKKNR